MKESAKGRFFEKHSINYYHNGGIPEDWLHPHTDEASPQDDEAIPNSDER